MIFSLDRLLILLFRSKNFEVVCTSTNGASVEDRLAKEGSGFLRCIKEYLKENAGGGK